MVLQHKAKTSLLEHLESHVWGNALEVAIQTKPPTSPPFEASQTNPAYKKRKRDPKGKEVMEEGMSPPTKDAKP